MGGASPRAMAKVQAKSPRGQTSYNPVSVSAADPAASIPCSGHSVTASRSPVGEATMTKQLASLQSTASQQLAVSGAKEDLDGGKTGKRGRKQKSKTKDNKEPKEKKAKREKSKEATAGVTEKKSRKKGASSSSKGKKESAAAVRPTSLPVSDQCVQQLPAVPAKSVGYNAPKSSSKAQPGPLPTRHNLPQASIYPLPAPATSPGSCRSQTVKTPTGSQHAITRSPMPRQSQVLYSNHGCHGDGNRLVSTPVKSPRALSFSQPQLALHSPKGPPESQFPLDLSMSRDSCVPLDLSMGDSPRRDSTQGDSRPQPGGKSPAAESLRISPKTGQGRKATSSDRQHGQGSAQSPASVETSRTRPCERPQREHCEDPVAAKNKAPQETSTRPRRDSRGSSSMLKGHLQAEQISLENTRVPPVYNTSDSHDTMKQTSDRQKAEKESHEHTCADPDPKVDRVIRQTTATPGNDDSSVKPVPAQVEQAKSLPTCPTGQKSGSEEKEQTQASADPAATANTTENVTEITAEKPLNGEQPTKNAATGLLQSDKDAENAVTKQSELSCNLQEEDVEKTQAGEAVVEVSTEEKVRSEEETFREESAAAAEPNNQAHEQSSSEIEPKAHEPIQEMPIENVSSPKLSEGLRDVEAAGDRIQEKSFVSPKVADHTPENTPGTVMESKGPETKKAECGEEASSDVVQVIAPSDADGVDVSKIEGSDAVHDPRSPRSVDPEVKILQAEDSAEQKSDSCDDNHPDTEECVLGNAEPSISDLSERESTSSVDAAVPNTTVCNGNSEAPEMPNHDPTDGETPETEILSTEECTANTAKVNTLSPVVSQSAEIGCTKAADPVVSEPHTVCDDNDHVSQMKPHGAVEQGKCERVDTEDLGKAENQNVMDSITELHLDSQRQAVEGQSGQSAALTNESRTATSAKEPSMEPSLIPEAVVCSNTETVDVSSPVKAVTSPPVKIVSNPPVKIVTSPVKVATSPVNITNSPVKAVNNSPVKIVTSPPVKVATSPVKVATSPVEVVTSPPVKVATSPVKVATSPPVKVATSPVKVATSPGKVVTNHDNEAGSSGELTQKSAFVPVRGGSMMPDKHASELLEACVSQTGVTERHRRSCSSDSRVDRIAEALLYQSAAKTLSPGKRKETEDPTGQEDGAKRVKTAEAVNSLEGLNSDTCMPAGGKGSDEVNGPSSSKDQELSVKPKATDDTTLVDDNKLEAVVSMSGDVLDVDESNLQDKVNPTSMAITTAEEPVDGTGKGTDGRDQHGTKKTTSSGGGTRTSPRTQSAVTPRSSQTTSGAGGTGPGGDRPGGWAGRVRLSLPPGASQPITESDKDDQLCVVPTNEDNPRRSSFPGTKRKSDGLGQESPSKRAAVPSPKKRDDKGTVSPEQRRMSPLSKRKEEAKGLKIWQWEGEAKSKLVYTKVCEFSFLYLY